MMPQILSLLIFASLITGCTTRSKPNVNPPGDDKTASTKFLETGARVIQGNAPVAGMDLYLVGLHPMKEHPEKQMEAHHFCRQLNEDFTQCALFDGNTKDANFNGVEYIISEKLFEALPEGEKKYWHPHNYKILSGQLIAPALRPEGEVALLKKKMNSYGKTWHFWNTGHHGLDDGQNLPLGEPSLSWAFTQDGQAVAGLVESMEKNFSVDTMKKREERERLVDEANPQRGVNTLRSKFAGPTETIPGVEEKKQAQEE